MQMGLIAGRMLQDGAFDLKKPLRLEPGPQSRLYLAPR
jgi:hypothetical protein